MDYSQFTILEGRNPHTGKLRDMYFDEAEWYVQREINQCLEEGWTEISIVQNPRNYKLTLNIQNEL